MEDLSVMKHFVGCDVSKRTLDFGLFVPKTDYRQFPHIKVSNDAQGYREVVSWLRKQGVSKQQLVIAMEHTGFYCVDFTEWLQSHKISFTMLHPLAVKSSFCSGRNKTDKVDAQYIADYVYTQREKLTTSRTEDAAIKDLRYLMSERKLAVKSQVMYRNLAAVQRNTAASKRLVAAINAQSDHIKQVENDMLACIESHPEIKRNYELLTSITGIGLINATATIVATGNFTRFQTSRQYAKFCKVAPLDFESGTSVRGGSHVPVMGHTELKTLLTEAARTAIMHDPQLRAYYERKRSEGKTHGCVLNAIKFKLVCRMFCVVKRGEKYVNIENYRSI